MKQVMKALMGILVWAGSFFAQGQVKMDDQRMDQDLEVAENILSTLIRQQFGKRNFFPMEVKSSYLPGYGVTFRLPMGGPFNAMMLEIESEHVTEVFTGFGQVGVRAEAVAEQAIQDARAYLAAQVPVGAYLSGGLDSSVLTTLIKNFTDTPLRTFSLTFADREFDESEHQRELVAYLGTRHSAVHCTAEALSDAFRRAIWHAETPILRTAPVPLMLLSQRVRAEGYKVVLTGEGADEVFAGYDLFKEAKIRRFWARAPASKLRPRALERLYPYLKGQRSSPAAGGAFTQMFFGAGMEHVDEPYFAHIPRWTTTRRIWQFFSPETRRLVGAWDPYRAYRDWLPCATGRWSPLARDQYAEAHTLLSGYLLSSQGDRMAMANSVEGRFPYLDHRVIEFANRLPPRYKLRALTEKYVLKQAVKGLLPEAIRRRVKQPYRAPDSQSFFRDGQPLEQVAELLSTERLREAGYFDPQAVAKLVAKCRDGRAAGFGDNMAFVGILSTMLVDDLFVRRRTPCQAALA